jgi:hypothetical protein
VRAKFSVLAIALYSGLFCIYVLQLNNPKASLGFCKAFYGILTSSMILYCRADMKKGFETSWQKQFNDIGWSVLIINYIFIILYHLDVITNIEKLIYLFCGSVFATTIFIFISGKRHGFFKNA